MKTIITKKGALPGKTLAVFAGVHGNETAGIEVVKKMIREIEPDRGTVHFVLANPLAIKNNVRYIESNLNRDFIAKQTASTYEQKRATVLMKLLDDCDTLLDLHAYRSDAKTVLPFAICEKRCSDVVEKFDLPISISGISSFQDGGTNGYMEKQNKVGIVVELGSIDRPEDFFDLGVRCVEVFLQHYQCLEGVVSTHSKNKTEYLKVVGVYRKNTSSFKFLKKYRSFDKITKNKAIASDGGVIVSAKYDGRIMFPSQNDAIGIEAFWLLSNES